MPLDVLAFYNGLDERARGYTFLQQYGHLINNIAFFQIPIQADGRLTGTPSRRVINEAHNMGMKVFITVSNLTAKGQFSTPLITRLVRDQAFANLVWRNIRDMLAVYRCDGVNLDLEKGRAEDRNLFTQLINQWAQLFRRENFIVTMDIPAKTADEPTDVWKGVFDYRALGQIVDGAILMTYEEHWPGSPPGSVASLPWVTHVLNYALTQIDRQKIYMGLPLYGYDWAGPNQAQVISLRRATEVARRHGATILWEPNQHSAFFHYDIGGRRHTVYFENIQSITEKLELAIRRDLRGIAIWEMNLSYREFWETLRAYV